ncbi:aminotransferase-like domain-containing protein [Burkholderia sp. NRF60-BP8]|uniref:aminotransferase-like domain-containing protein n=1 Tax=Burkholderia sp. NRF60-BP8 TaxID=1637853 RepID=UPI0009E72AB2|nr:PLP-dependent aminotransferase family protein [Burkholderia sp. NRF60-BP8]
MKIQFDDGARTPLSEQIASTIERMIAERRLMSGSKLPSIRRLAAQSGVSLFPVVEAYDRLVSRGLVCSRPGVGYFVVEGAIPALDLAERGVLRAQIDERSRSIQRFNLPGDTLKLGSGVIPEPWRDIDGLSAAIRQVVRDAGGSLVDYGTPLGNPQLRAALLQQAARFGIDATMPEIMLTAGISHGLDLVVRCFVQRGDTVLVDDPGYFNLFNLLRMQGVHVVGVPRLPNGPDLACLETLVKTHRPTFYFVNTVLHNPTGSTIDPRVCMRLLFLAETYDLRIVEDDVHADLEFEPSDRLAKLGGRERVIHVGGLSKLLSSSLRIGYVIASSAVIDMLADVKAHTMVGCSPFAEAVVYEWFRRGGHRRHTERLRARLHAAMHDTMRELEASGWELFVRPKGGSLLWARLPGIDDSAELAANAEYHGVTIAPGSYYHVDNNVSPWLRINVAYARDRRALSFLQDSYARDRAGAVAAKREAS